MEIKEYYLMEDRDTVFDIHFFDTLEDAVREMNSRRIYLTKSERKKVDFEVGKTVDLAMGIGGIYIYGLNP